MPDVVLRTQAQINEEYTQCALALGDKQFKVELAQAEIKELKKKMLVLAKEKPAPVEEVAA